jgi:hypothetical protein
MNTILIVGADGSHAPYEESQVRTLVEQGRISRDTLYWKAGMSEWRPLREFLFSSQFPSPETKTVAPNPISEKYKFNKDPTALTAFVQFMLLVLIIISGLRLFANISLVVIIMADGFNQTISVVNDITQGIFGLFRLLAYIVTAVAFLKWIYRANLNCRGFGANNLKFTPGWSIGYYFIPIACLALPYQAMKEIWQASTNPVNWEKCAGSSLLGFWWAFWLITSILGQIYFRLGLHQKDTLNALAIKTWVEIAHDIGDIILCILAFFVIKTIYGKQKRLVDGASFLHQATLSENK